MSHRLQVLLQDDEFREIQAAASEERMTVSEWVRQRLRDARRSSASRSVDDKQRAIAAAAAHSFPTGEIEEMLEEIEQGYRSL